MHVHLWNLVVRLVFSSTLQIWYVEERISRSVSEGPFDFEKTRVDCIYQYQYNATSDRMTPKIYHRYSCNIHRKQSVITQHHLSGRVVRWYCVIMQCRRVRLILTIVGQGPAPPAMGAREGCFWTILLSFIICLLSPFLQKTSRYRLKYCLKGPFPPPPPTHTQKKSHRLTAFTLLKAFAVPAK